MKRLIKKVIPQRLHFSMRRLWLRTRHFGVRHFCPICRSYVSGFLPHGIPPQPNAVCPVCRSKEPHRLSCLYFQQKSGLFHAGETLLHIAPEPEFERRLRQWARRNRMSYRKGDIRLQGDEHLDVRDLPFADHAVDLIYCCHVLNMVREDGAAMRELFRVLRPGGTALLVVPAYCQGATSLEPLDTDGDRIRCFGYPDIIRMYTDSDYVSRLENAGFVVYRFRADDMRPAIVRRCGLKQEVLHICHK
jgi:SAM-dependent methyltransferase